MQCGSRDTWTTVWQITRKRKHKENISREIMKIPVWTISLNLRPVTKQKFPSDHATFRNMLQAAISILLPVLCDLSSQHCSTLTRAVTDLEQCSLTKLALATAAEFGSANCLCTIKFNIFHLFRSSWPEKFNISQSSGHYMYRTVVTVCTTSLTFNNSTFCAHSVFMCFVWIWEKTAIISLYNINWLVFMTEI